MKIPDEVITIANDIKSMKIRGAGKIARSAAEALKIAAEKYDEQRDPVVFKKYILKVADLLISTRPTAVSLPNAVLYVVYVLEKAGDSFDELRKAVINRAQQFIEDSLKALDKIADYGANRIKDNAVLMTHCHSTASVP